MSFNFTRKRFASSTETLRSRDMLRASAALDFPSIAAGNNQTLTVPVVGAAVGDDVVLVRTAAPVNGALNYVGWVSAAGVVSVRAQNNTAGAIDPASETFRVIVFKA